MKTAMIRMCKARGICSICSQKTLFHCRSAVNAEFIPFRPCREDPWLWGGETTGHHSGRIQAPYSPRRHGVHGEPSRNQKTKSHRRDAEPAEVVPGSARFQRAFVRPLHAGCV